MAVVSNSFGGLRLSDGDATKFRNQVRFGRANAQARQSVANGLVMARALLGDGQAVVTSAEIDSSSR